MTQLLILAVKQRDEFLAVEVPEDKAVWKAEFDKMEAISKTLDLVVSLVAQASQITLYYKRYLILVPLVRPQKRQKRYRMTGSLSQQTTRLKTYLLTSSMVRFAKVRKQEPL